MNEADPPDERQRWSAPLAELAAALPDWLETRRWFADKGRGIEVVDIEDALIEDVDRDTLVLAVAQMTFRGGEDARYLLPLAWTEHPGDAAHVAFAPVGGKAGAFIEAVDAPWFGRWLVEAMRGTGHREAADWLFAAHPAATEILASARTLPATVLRAEQSNTSLRYGDSLMVKLVRRLQPGPNPDEEMLRALAGIGFARVPPYVGGATWHASDGETYPIALAQAFVPNLGDGWSWMLQRLRNLSPDVVGTVLGEGSPEWLLGRRTGELHMALAQIDEPGFAPEPTTATSIAAHNHRVQNAVAQSISLLGEEEPRLPASLGGSLPAIIEGLRSASVRSEGFAAEAGTQRIRVHGDYHLGQTLRTQDEDWVIIDFEGEPARPVAERRQKTSALKDVSGMLRSFAYARGVAERERSEDPGDPHRERIAAWETAARKAFLDGYRDAVSHAPVPLVPVDDAAFTPALAAWELDKALYEIAYEVRNRPDWVELPLRSLLPNVAHS
jgi:maltose alpha-D-glucosyltransferase/alpha-amylase